MSIFSLDWFKSERDKELEQLKIEEQRLKNQLLQKMIDSPDLFKNYKHDESQHIKAISTHGDISIFVPDKKEHKAEPKEEPKDVVPEKSVTIDEQLPRTMPSKDIEWVKEITEEGLEVETPIIPEVILQGITPVAAVEPTTVTIVEVETTPEQQEIIEEVRAIVELTPQGEPKALLGEILEVIEMVKDIANKKEEKVILPAPPVVHATVYKTAKLINNVINVILRDGTILTKVGVDRDFFDWIKSAQTEEEIRDMFVPKEAVYEKRREDEKKEVIKKEIEEVKAILKGIDLLVTLPDFVVEGDSVCLKETKRSMPKLMVEEFSKLVGKYPNLTQEGFHKNNEYMALKNFFLWCCLNPRPEVANQLYDFLMKNSFRITKQGFFVAMRNVVTVRNDNSSAKVDRDLVDFVTNAYQKVKAVWKMKPDNFRVVQMEDKSYKLENINKETKGKFVGNLIDLYKKKLPEMPGNRFTDDYTKSFDIRVGKVVNMPPEKCNWSTKDCAEAGLHFTADQIHYVGCGDTSVLVLINPMKVVGIGQQKGRCYEYLPIMTVPRDEATSLLHDVAFDTLELDEDYAIRELESLTTKSKEGFVSESTKYKFSIPSVPVSEIKNIFESLKEMEKTLSKRISIIK